MSSPAKNPWAGRRVLVTGASGIVGSWLTKALLARGSTVVTLVADLDPQSEFVQSADLHRVKLVYGGLEQPGVVERALGAFDVDTVFHLGAQTLVGPARRLPVATFEINIRGTYLLLDACRAFADQLQAVVVASSDKAYGAASRLPYDEGTPLAACHPYDVSKACADLLALSYHHTFGLPTMVARCGNIYGGGDLNWSRIVPGTIRALLRGERPIIRSDGLYVRDYLYVKDAVLAYLSLAEAAFSGTKGLAFNFSGDARRSVLEVVTAIQHHLRTNLEPDIRNTATAEIREQWLSSEKAARVLGWRPAFSFDVGLVETISWYREWQERWEPA